MDIGIDVRSIDRTELRDINSVQIDMALSREERIKSYVEQIGNPYCYIDDGIVVGIGYANTPISLQERLQAYACSLD
ncbi:hypothetical protein D3Z52_00380 [Clostridiaceae bacterium]|jgi:hypothetical protein|nr:hypothetical protein [Clostridiaceae bacterium]NBI81197.1 hypothetical protein [Clostridiaceae bacterium]RKJ83031.1 hypothetical protein D7X33_00825 [Butyricicoccus sp. 1XD8-22]